MSEKTRSQKLQIKPGYTVALVNAPRGHKAALGPLPAGAKLVGGSARAVSVIQILKAANPRVKILIGLHRAGANLWITKPREELWITKPRSDTKARRAKYVRSAKNTENAPLLRGLSA